ncbi:ATP-dependent DNA helicase [Pedobacter gandavensis]|uniref:AAA family ATPase n=1 Tax=Pedobacter gandavensis TaxID=2679963 RepID=A0ABR6ESH6_9SPHI|nr:AAA family ATPase [Pedobacter gandavensis]MBB2147373.1 AAA family ATPase [Pedobacter gandavensis]
MNKHLSIRVAWHDSAWNGKICRHPTQNTFCIHLPRILKEKNDELEENNAGIEWSSLPDGFLPPCQAEGGAFMNTGTYSRTFNHPYNRPGKDIPHSNLKPTTIQVPAFSSFAVPFWWMLKGNQQSLKSWYPDLPRDDQAPFPSSWVYGPVLQNKLLDRFFEPIKVQDSLAIYYVKGANPIDENSNRLIGGVGNIIKKSAVLRYDSKVSDTYPMWDRLISHGIRPDQPTSEGILLPYQVYLNLPDDFILKTKDAKKTKYELIDEIKLTLQDIGSRQEMIEEFAYGAEWVNDSTLLSVLTKLRIIIERIIEHGIAKGFWREHLIWIDRQIGKVKENMGPFPSFANALLAFGFQHANLLEEDLRNDYGMGAKDNCWNGWEDAIYGRINLSTKSYGKDLPYMRDIWLNESKERIELLQLLSRFEFSEKQISNWFNSINRSKIDNTISNKSILLNPYLIAEEDPGDQDHYPIAIETIDNGVFEDIVIQGSYAPIAPQVTSSALDPRRLRALICVILKDASINGDTLLSVNEINERLASLNLQRSTIVPENYINSNLEFIKDKLDWLQTEDKQTLQLKKYAEIENYFRKTFIARAKRKLDPLTEDWDLLLRNTLAHHGKKIDEYNERHVEALKDQVKALHHVTGSKLSVLLGPAGTGKTTVMGALFGSSQLRREGILLLAPTGKASVKLGNMAGTQASTIAQFLTKQKRFDWGLLKPKFTGPTAYQAEQNVIIDECSMLTEDDLYALLKALDLAHVKRIILVGDPYQLPPIGAGRPFADLCNYLKLLEPGNRDIGAQTALARLTAVVRTVQGANSDSLILASWFSGIKPSKGADAIFSKLGNNKLMNDLETQCWSSSAELKEKLIAATQRLISKEGGPEVQNFNQFIGISDRGINTSKIEAFQILTPVKDPYWGTFNLNRMVQAQFNAHKKDSVTIGEYRMMEYDKVIQTRNEKKEAYPGNQELPISNGQLGLIANIAKGYANVSFSGIQSGITFGYKSQRNTEGEEANIELAYAITIHKSQGSDFDYVFLVIPKTGRIISRELIYTALTRAKTKLVLFIEGDNPHWIINLSKPQYSETAKRNTNIFSYAVRNAHAHVPYVEGLIHKTKQENLLVRSKSEVIIANELEYRSLPFQYERQYTGKNGEKKIPDFSFTDAAGDLIILEHLGMLSVPGYRADWEKKKQFYLDNGFIEGENLFITTESELGGIDSKAIEHVIDQIEELL